MMMNRTITLVLLAAAFAIGGAWMLTRSPAAGDLGHTLLPGAAMAQDAADPAIDISTVAEMA